MPETYSRVCSASLIKEAVSGTPLTPTTFFPFIEEKITTEYGYLDSMPVQGLRTKRLRPVKNKIAAPAGDLLINVEPRTIGHFLRGLCGGFLSGAYLPYTPALGAFAVGDVITQAVTGFTATVVGVDLVHNVLVVTGATGVFSTTNAITGAPSTATGTPTFFNAAVYAHMGSIEATSEVSYSMQFNYTDRAIRYFGVRFFGLDQLAQSDNFIQANIKVMAKAQFRHAKVEAITASGAGAKTITLDQTSGLVAGDTIKLYRPGTGFLDFVSAGVKTHTIGTVPTELTLTVTNLETATAVGDLIMLAPQTPSYTISNEMFWIGGSQISTGATVDAMTVKNIEEFNIMLTNEYEERHSAYGLNLVDRFPTALLRKGYEANGMIKFYNQNEDYMKLQRLNTAQALKFASYGALLSATVQREEMRITFPQVYFNPFQNNINSEDIINDEVNWAGFYDTTEACLAKILLINAATSY
jgi:hypothetical protein